MKEEYKEFADKFRDLCEEFAGEDFTAEGIIESCKEVMQDFADLVTE